MHKKIHIGITGVNGFIGSHLRLVIQSSGEYSLTPFNRSFFNRQTELDKFVKSCDVVIHTASVIKHQDEDFLYNENIRMTTSLVESINRTGSKTQIIFLSSVQSGNSSAYGKSKAVAEELLKNLSNTKGIRISILKLPGIYGEGQKPYFNSVVPTFCTQIIREEASEINETAEIEILHVRHVVNKCIDLIDNKELPTFNTERIVGTKITVGRLYKLLSSFRYYDRFGVIPKLISVTEIDLFNTYRFCYFDLKNPSVFNLVKHIDDRGELFDVLQTNLKGQVFFSTTKPGVVRGNHYHTRKIERFCVVKGTGVIRLINLFTKEIKEVSVSGLQPVAVDIPTYCLHTIENSGTNILETIFWSNEFLNLHDTDTLTI